MFGRSWIFLYGVTVWGLVYIHGHTIQRFLKSVASSGSLNSPTPPLLNPATVTDDIGSTQTRRKPYTRGRRRNTVLTTETRYSQRQWGHAKRYLHVLAASDTFGGLDCSGPPYILGFSKCLAN